MRLERPPASAPPLLHYRQLAMRVIALALRDLRSSAGSPADRASARAFLSGAGLLTHWCAVAELDPSRVVRHASRLRASRTRLNLTKEVKKWQQ